MKFGWCITKIKDVPVLEKSNFDFVEFCVEIVQPELPEKEFMSIKEKISSLTIKPETFNCFIPGDMKIVGNEVDFGRLSNYVSTALRRISSIGGKIVVFGSGGARNVPDGFSVDKAYEQIFRFLQMAADNALDNNITIAIEPIYKKGSNIINTTEEALQIAKEVKRKEIKVLTDLFHFTQEKEPFSHLLDAKDYLVHIHVPVPDIEGARPTDVVYNFHKILNCLKEIDYQERISIEDNGGRLTDFENQCPLALKFMRELWNKTVLKD